MKIKHTNLCPNKKRCDRENGILDPVVKVKRNKLMRRMKYKYRHENFE